MTKVKEIINIYTLKHNGKEQALIFYYDNKNEVKQYLVNSNDKNYSLFKENSKREITFSDLENNLEAIIFASKDGKINSLSAKNLLNNIKNKFLETALAASIVAMPSLSACNNKKVTDANIYETQMSGTTSAKEETSAKEGTSTKDFSKMTYEELISATTLEAQKNAMKAVGEVLDDVNVKLGSKVNEKDIVAGISFDEATAMYVASNNLSATQIAAIYNGYSVKAGNVEENYKNAFNLLTYNLVMADNKEVDLSKFSSDSEGVKFVSKYNNLYYAIKAAKNKEDIEKALNNFYTTFRQDYSYILNKEDIEIGFAHDYYTELNNRYEVLPLIYATALEVQYRNFTQTLTTEEINIINQYGICNELEDIFRLVQDVTNEIDCNTDCIVKVDECDFENNPKYTDFRKASNAKLGKYAIVKGVSRKIEELTTLISKLNITFINGEYTISTYENGYYYEYNSDGSVVVKEVTETTYKNTTSTNTITREEAIKKFGLARVEEMEKEAKAKCEANIAKENEEAKKQGYYEASIVDNAITKEIERDTRAKEKIVQEKENDFNNKINEANNQINKNNESQTDQNKPINEKDFGDHNVTFDKNYTDGNGNLDSSVKNIGTDSKGVEEQLPDPNETGKKFDTYSASTDSNIIEYIPNELNDNPVIVDATTTSYEGIVETYVESLDGIGETENNKVLTK